jgi:hypothetical protein
MANIWVILGNSRVGKDTATRELGKLLGKHTILKFSAVTKRLFEQWYGLPDGALEHDCYRNEPVPGLNGETYLDVLIHSFDYLAAIDPLLTIRPLEATAIQALAGNWDIIFNDLRKPLELEMIMRLQAAGHCLNVLRLSRSGTSYLPSDRYITELALRCQKVAQHYQRYDNDGSLEGLSEAVALFHYKAVNRNATHSLTSPKQPDAPECIGVCALSPDDLARL